ncbi:MAG: hypothetical protein R3F30_02625 [Planctomycetota bacterium]
MDGTRAPSLWPRDPVGRLVVVGLLALLLYQLLELAWLPGPLEATRLRDDAYYVLATARNLADGEGFTFDGVHPAAGVQVLWTLVLAVPALLLGSAALPAVAVALGLAAHLASAWLAYGLLRRLVVDRMAFGLAALYASRPGLVQEAMNGQETALAMLCLFAWAGLALPIGDRGPRRGWPLRVLTLCLPWVRTDAMLLPAGYLAAALWAPRFGGPRLPLRPMLGLTVVSGLVYLLGQRLLLGHWLPPSGDAVPWLFHAQVADRGGGLSGFLRAQWWYTRPVLLGGPFTVAANAFGLVVAWWILAPLSWRKRSIPLLLVLVAWLAGAQDLTLPLVAGLLLLFTSFGARMLHMEQEGRVVTGLVLGFVLLLVLHLPLRWYPRDYYFVPLALPAVLILGTGARRFLGTGFPFLTPQRKVRLVWFGLLLMGLATRPWSSARFPWQAETSFAAEAASALLPEAGIAAFNAGLLGWHHRGPLRNLDGAADGAALPALRERRLLAWLEAEGIGWLLDTPRQVADEDPDRYAPHASGRFLGPEGSRALVPWIGFDLTGVAGRHPGTDVHVLYALPGTVPPPLDGDAALLSRDRRGVVVRLRQLAGTRVQPRWLLEEAGVERVWSPDPSAQRLPWVVTRFPGATGRLLRDGVEVLRW